MFFKKTDHILRLFALSAEKP